MESIGLLLECDQGRLKEANFGMAALVDRDQDQQGVAIVVNASIGEIRATLAAHGISRILHIHTTGPDGNPAYRASAIAAAMERFAIKSLVGLTSPEGRELLPRIAALLDAPLIMDCIDIDLGSHRVRTSQYSGKTIATINLQGSHFLYGLRPNVIEPRKKTVDAKVLDFTFEEKAPREYRLVETRTQHNGTPHLAEAQVIFAGGRGMKNGENFDLLFACARRLNASVGASRVAVDNGWVPYAMQVGQTGVKVNPKVYLAVGISGSIQHFAGMKTAKTIIAINTDANAAIMANCDYYAVGDLFDILPALEAALGSVKR